MEGLRHGLLSFAAGLLITRHLDYGEGRQQFRFRTSPLSHSAGQSAGTEVTVSRHGKDVVNPSLDAYKTKADVMNLLQQAVADIQPDSTAARRGLDKTTKFPFGNKAVHNSYCWMLVVECSGEHYGQLAARYRASRSNGNNIACAQNVSSHERFTNTVYSSHIQQDDALHEHRLPAWPIQASIDGLLTTRKHS